MNNHAYNTACLLALNHKPMWAFFSGGTLIRMTESKQDAAKPPFRAARKKYPRNPEIFWTCADI